MFGQDRVDRVPVGQVTLDEGGRWVNGAAVALVKIVKDDDLLAASDELFDDDATDVAGAAGDENFHRGSPSATDYTDFTDCRKVRDSCQPTVLGPVCANNTTHSW